MLIYNWFNIPIIYCHIHELPFQWLFAPLKRKEHNLGVGLLQCEMKKAEKWFAAVDCSIMRKKAMRCDVFPAWRTKAFWGTTGLFLKMWKSILLYLFCLFSLWFLYSVFPVSMTLRSPSTMIGQLWFYFNVVFFFCNQNLFISVIHSLFSSENSRFLLDDL